MIEMCTADRTSGFISERRGFEPWQLSSLLKKVTSTSKVTGSTSPGVQLSPENLSLGEHTLYIPNKNVHVVTGLDQKLY